MDHAPRTPPGEPPNPSLSPVFVRPLDLSHEGAGRAVARFLRSVAAVKSHIASLAVLADGMDAMPGSCIGIIDHPGLERFPRKSIRAAAEAAYAECMRRLAQDSDPPEFGNDPGVVPIHREDWSIRARGPGWKIEVRGIPAPLGIEGLPKLLLPGDVGGFALSREGDGVMGHFDVSSARSNPRAGPPSLPRQPVIAPMDPYGPLKPWEGPESAPNST